MRRLTLTALTLVFVLVTTACASNKVTTWKSPDIGTRVFKKIAVFAIAIDPQVRRTVENAFARGLNGESRAIPSHTFTTAEDVKDKEKVVAKVKEGGYDGAIVFRLVAVDEQKSETWGVTGYYPSYGFSGYWGSYAVVTYGSVYSNTQKIVQIETTLYGMPDEKPAWAATNKMTDPNSTMDVIEKIVNGAISSLKSDKLIR